MSKVKHTKAYDLHDEQGFMDYLKDVHEVEAYLKPLPVPTFWQCLSGQPVPMISHAYHNRHIIIRHRKAVARICIAILDTFTKEDIDALATSLKQANLYKEMAEEQGALVCPVSLRRSLPTTITKEN